MGKVHDIAVDVIEDLRQGKLPIDTAVPVHLTMHRAVWDRCIDEKMARRIADEESREKLRKVSEDLTHLKR